MTKKRYHVLGYHNHRLLGLLFVVLVFATSMLPLISAYGLIDLKYGSQQLLNLVKDAASPLFEVLIGDYSGEEFFFVKSLLLILIFTLIFFILQKFNFLNLNENRIALFIVSLVTSILAIRFIPETDVIRAMILPYSTLGIAVSLLIPSIIFGIFIHKANLGSIVRRIGWTLYIILFLVLWNSRYYELSPIGNQIYGWFLVACIIMLIFDRQIHKFFELSEMRKIQRSISDDQAVKLINTYYDAVEAYNKTHSEEAKRRMEFLRKRLAEEHIKLD